MEKLFYFDLDFDNLTNDKTTIELDNSDIEDNDDLFWNHKYTPETDDDGFPPYGSELDLSNEKSIDTDINFFNKDI